MKNPNRIFKTIQQNNNLNLLFFDNDPQPKSNGIHTYLIQPTKKRKAEPQRIVFQNGPRNERGSQHGVLDSDLLEIVRHRLEQFQSGEYACKENEMALEKVTEALMWLNKRVSERSIDGTLGTNKK